MIKKAASHRFPARARVYVFACPFPFRFVLSLNSFLSIGILIFFVCFAFLGWDVGVSLHERVLYLGQSPALSLCLFKKEGKRGGNG